MAKFTTKLSVELEDQQAAQGRGSWSLSKKLVYQSDVAAQTITIPVGFVTDFASVPRFPSLFFSIFGDIASEAAVVHDYLYYTGILGRKLSDEVLREAALATGCAHWKAMGLYLGVRLVGWHAYNKYAAKRMMLPYARHMIHQPSGGTHGKATDMEIDLKEILNMKKVLTQIYVNHNSKGKTFKQLASDMERDYFMSAQAALDYGLVDEIVTKRQ